MRLRLLHRPRPVPLDAWGRPATEPDVGVTVRLTREISPLLHRGLVGTIERRGVVNPAAGTGRVWWVLFDFSSVSRPIFEDELEVAP